MRKFILVAPITSTIRDSSMKMNIHSKITYNPQKDHHFMLEKVISGLYNQTKHNFISD